MAENDPIKVRQSVYKDLGLESQGVSYDDFSKMFDTNEDFRKSVYNDMGFESEGVDFDNYSNVMGVPLGKQQEVLAQGSAITSQTSVEPGVNTNVPNQLQQANSGQLLGQSSEEFSSAVLPEGATVLEGSDGTAYYDPSKAEDVRHINVLPDATVVGKRVDKGFMSDVKNSFMSGLTDFNAGLSAIPEYLYRIAAVPQNLLADAIDNNMGDGSADWLRARYSNIENGVYNPIRILSDYSKGQKEQSETYAKDITQFEDDILGSITNGNFGDAGRQVFNSITQSIPAVVGMVATSGAGTAANLGNLGKNALSALPFAAGAYQDIESNDKMPENMKLVASGLKGLSEVVFEQGFGTQKLIESIASKAMGKEAVKEMVEGYMSRLLNSNGIPASAFKGSVSEGATTLAQNMIAKYSGEKPDQDLWEGVADAMIVGGVMDAGVSGSGKLATSILSKENKTKVSELESQNEALRNDIDSAENPDVIQQALEANTEEINSIMNEDAVITQSLAPEIKQEVNSIDQNISDIQNEIESENVSDDTKTALESQVKVLESERDDLVENNMIPEQKVKVSDATPEKGVYFRDGEAGEFKTDEGGKVTFETESRIYEIGEQDDVSGRDVGIFGIEVEKPIDVSIEDNQISLDGQKYVNNYSNPEAAINRDADGKVVSINLETEDGKKRTIRGQRADAIAYEYNKLSNENNQVANKPVVENVEVAPVGEAVQSTQEVVESPVDTVVAESLPTNEVVATESETVVAPERTEFANQEEFVRNLTETSNDPSEIAREYYNTAPGEADYKSQSIMDYIGNSKINEQDYARYGDRNNLDANKKRRWVDSGNKGLSLDTAAQELSDIIGVEVTPADFIDFIDTYKGTSDFTESTKSPSQVMLESKYKELTGKNLTYGVAERAVNKFNREMSEEDVFNLNTDLQEMGITYEDIKNYEDFIETTTRENAPGIQQSEPKRRSSNRPSEKSKTTQGKQPEVKTEPKKEVKSPVASPKEKSSPKSLAESLKTKESRQVRAEELRARINSYRQANSGLGISQDSKKQAEYWRDITDYAIIRIVDGAIFKAEQLADELGIKLDSNVRKAFNEAKKDIVENSDLYGSNSVTASKNIETAKKRSIYGFDERLKPNISGFEAVSNEADRIMRDDPYSAEKSLNKAINGDILTDVETVILTKYGQQKEQSILDHNQALEESGSTMGVSDFNSIKDKRNADIDKLMSIYEALENTGTMAARSLNIRKMLLIQDLSLPGMMSEMRQGVGGRPLTEAENNQVLAKFREVEDKRQAIQKRNEELETENARLNAELELARQANELALDRRRRKDATATKTEAIADVRKRREEAKVNLKNALKEAFFSDKLGFAANLNENAKNNIKNDKNLIKALNALVRTYIEEAQVRFGKVDFDAIIDKIHADVIEVVPNATREQVMNFIDSSNTDTRPTKTQLQQEMGLFRTQLKLMNEIASLESGGIFKRKPKSDPVTNATVEGLKTRLAELRALMEDPADIVERRNKEYDAKIAELESKIQKIEDEGVYTREKKASKPILSEIDALQKDLAKLRKEKADINDKISDRKKATQKRIDQIKKDLAEKNFSTERKQLVLDDPELNKLRKELDKLQYDFKVAVKKAEYDRRSWPVKIADALVEAVAIPRTLMATGDLSAPLRQLVYTIPSRPIMAAKVIGKMFQFWSSESQYENWQDSIKESEVFGLANKAGLSLTGLVGNVSASAKEEQFMSNIVDRVEKSIPILGSKGVKFELGGKKFDFYIGANARAERGFTGAINKMRMDLFTRGSEILMNEGKTFLTHPEDFKSLATYINAVTGRGPMPQSMDGAMKYMSTVFFAPRLMSSRLWLLAGGPLYSANPLVRKMYIRDTAAFIGFGLSLMVAGTMAGMKTLGDDEEDWVGETNVEKVKNLMTSVDFMNLKLGDRRYDVWGGFGQYVKFFVQEATGQRVTSTGNIKKLDGEGYNSMTRGDLVLRFGRSKLSPTMSLATSFLQGRNYMGEPFSLTKELTNMSAPLVWQDTYEAWGELNEGPKSIATTFIPSFFGLGVQYWKSNKGMELGQLPLSEKHKQLLATKSVGTMAKDAADIDLYDVNTGKTKNPTGPEYKKYMDLWSDYIKADLNENMAEYEKMSKEKFGNKFNSIKSAATEYAKKTVTGVSSYDLKIETDGNTYLLTPDQVKDRIKEMDQYKKDYASEYDNLKDEYKRQGMSDYEVNIKVGKKIESDARAFSKALIVDKLSRGEIKLKQDN